MPDLFWAVSQDFLDSSASPRVTAWKYMTERYGRRKAKRHGGSLVRIQRPPRGARGSAGDGEWQGKVTTDRG